MATETTSKFNARNLPREVSFSGGPGREQITTLPGGRKALASLLTEQFGGKVRFIPSHATGFTQVVVVPDSLASPGANVSKGSISQTKSGQLPPDVEVLTISDFLKKMTDRHQQGTQLV